MKTILFCEKKNIIFNFNLDYFICLFIEENTKLVKGTEESLHGSRSSGDWHHLQGEIQQSYQQLQVIIYLINE